MDLDQCKIKAFTTGYKYTNSIRVSESIDLSAPSGGSDNLSKRKVYGMAKFNGSPYNTLAVAAATAYSRSLSLFWWR